MKRLLYLILFIPFLLEGQGLVWNNRIVFTDSLLWVDGTGIVKDRNEVIKAPIYKSYEILIINFNDSAEALFARITGDEPIDFKNAASEFYDSIQTYHIDDTLDFLYNFAAHNTQAACLDWLHPTRTATLVNAPVHTAYEGYLTNGSSSYIKTNYNPGTDAVNWLLNSASMGFYIRTNTYANNQDVISIGGGSNYAVLRINLATFRFYINAATYVLLAHGNDVTGFTIMTRQNATTIAYARNSAVYTTASSNSTGIPDQALGIFVGAYNNNGSAINYTPQQFSFAFGGGQLTELQKTKLYEAMERYLDRFGKGVN